MIRYILIAFFASAAPSVAEVSFLQFPVDCTLGESCFILNYPDTDASDQASDYRCGAKTADGNSGTDIALVTFDQMQDGVPVIAAAPGRVQAIRNTLPDQPYIPGTPLNGQECGNAVRIDHGNGYQTVYCHMKLGSVLVTPGQRVLAGQPLGLVGLSGRTIYPHLHLTVTQGAAVIDPFAPDQDNSCAEPSERLWQETPEYIDAGLIAAGVSDRVPDIEDIQSGAAQRDAVGKSQAMVLFGLAFNGDAGDEINLTMHGPEGIIFEHSARLEADQTKLFRAFGRRAPGSGWPSGDYRGDVTLIRGETVLAVRHADVTVD